MPRRLSLTATDVRVESSTGELDGSRRALRLFFQRKSQQHSCALDTRGSCVYHNERRSAGMNRPQIKSPASCALGYVPSIGCLALVLLGFFLASTSSFSSFLTIILLLLSGTCAAYEFDVSTVRSRNSFGHMINERNFTVGAELGVQSGYFSDGFLYTAHSITRYYLVDTWEQRSNYSDGANVPNEIHNANYRKAKVRLAPYGDKCVFLRNFTTEAVKQLEDSSLDFIYVDARHDYCGVLEDLETWWPKLRKGGIMCGDDYLTAAEQLGMKGNVYDPNDDWAICGNGTKIAGAVKGAVQDFAKRVGVQVHTTWKHDNNRKEFLQWPQWIYDYKP